MTLPNWPAPESPQAQQPYVPPQQPFAPPPPRGWYQDPQVQGQERWWSGFEWTDATHKASYAHPSSSLGAYTRSRWAGLNRSAKYAEISAGAGVMSFFVWFIVTTIGASGSGTAGAAPVALGIVTVGLLLATIVLSGFGLARATYFGGTALAGWSLAIGIVLALGFAVTALGFAAVG
jgi:hypothetical protein